jgi:7-dehydrocholesterol reductase
MYTLQVQYLARNPVEMSWLSAISTLSLGLGGYVLFRSVNHQKDLVRRTKGDCMIWGEKAQFVRAAFKTSDGVPHESLLLTSGWWGMARHANYVGDLMLSFAMCATCGFDHLLPWSYAIFMTAILIHRCHRDEKRCSAKYGDTWVEYRKQVPWRLVPGLY